MRTLRRTKEMCVGDVRFLSERSARDSVCREVACAPYRRSLTLDCTTRFNNVVVASFAYTFDAHNRPVARNSDRFAYNDRDEIVGATIGTNRISRAYDTIGNHVFCAYNSATNFYANNALNQTTASYVCAPSIGSSDNDAQSLFAGYDILSTNKLTWSAQGGLQRDGRFIYAFDAEDQLVSVTSATLTNGAIRVVNAYDYRHRRIAKTVYTMRDDSPPTSPLAPPLPIAHRSWHLQERHDFVYDNWNLIHETVTTVNANSTTNVTEIEYFWGPDLSNTLQGAGGVGGLLAVSRNGQFYFPVYDNLGNVVKYLDENGNIVASYTYDDFGNILSSSGSMPDIFVFCFSTKYVDLETGFYYYGYRFYSPQLRCWLNSDPLGESVCGSLCSFVRNNTFQMIDYLGMLPSVVWDSHNVDANEGTFDESFYHFFAMRTPRTFHYYYPKDSATVRLLQQKDVKEIWELFQRADVCFGRRKDSVFHHATMGDYCVDVVTFFGAFSPENFNAFDWGYRVLGSFRINYEITTDYSTCSKRLKMEVKNTWSALSLTRNPLTGNTILPDFLFTPLKDSLRPVDQVYHYDVRERATPVQHLELWSR